MWRCSTDGHMKTFWNCFILIVYTWLWVHNWYFSLLFYDCCLLVGYLNNFYKSYILPLFTYGFPTGSTINKTHIGKLEVLHRRILRIILRTDRHISNLDLYAAASTTTLQHYLDASKCTLAHSIFLDQHPAHLQSLNWFNSGGTTRSCVRLP